MTLLDTLVGSALMLVIFLGIAAAFQLSVDVVINNKARGGAIGLAAERMEYVRSLAYASIGTAGGIPSGTIAQTETVALNGVTYTRRTLVEYADDPKDGTGASDANGITSDYKVAKVDVAWTARAGARHVALVSRFEPQSGMETACTPPCGTLTINVVDSASLPLSGASVSIVNASTSPVINISTFSNASGTASFIGAPASAGYAIVVTKTGYSSAQTYSVTAENTNPNPGHLTVSNSQTTSGTFQIDVTGQKNVRTWTQILAGTWSDTFANANKVATSTNITVEGGAAVLSGAPDSYAASGNSQSVLIGPSSLYRWKTFIASTSIPAQTDIRFRFYDGAGTSLIPDSMISGNSAGLASTSVSLLGVSTTTYPSLRIESSLTSDDPVATPSIDSYSVSYEYGPDPLPNIIFTLQGGKTVGSGPSGAVYKYTQSHTTGSSASITVPALEWDTYTTSLNGSSTGYDIASSCPTPQPETLLPAASMTTDLYLALHTTNSLLVDVRSATTSALLPDMAVNVWRSGGYNATSTTDSCGQVFLSGLTSSNDYSIMISGAGYSDYTASGLTVEGTTRLSVTIN